MPARKKAGEGKNVWVIPDGDLPPKGTGDLPGHESLIILNTGRQEAKIKLDFYFEDRPPKTKISVSVPAERVKCFRLDKPIAGYQVPFGQYALRVTSSVPVIVQFGRLDVRQPNMAYYCTMAYPVR